jgi:serine/threonine protein kinase
MARFSGDPGIVNVRDYFTENNTAYIVMDYLDGVTLDKWLEKNKGISVEKTLSLMKPVMATLSRIHKKGLIHRDVSPDNIMMLKDNQIKLLDFGAVRNSYLTN